MKLVNTENAISVLISGTSQPIAIFLRIQFHDVILSFKNAPILTILKTIYFKFEIEEDIAVKLVGLTNSLA